MTLASISRLYTFVLPPVSLAFVEAQDWDSYRREQGLITSSMEKIEGKSDFYGVFNVRLGVYI